MTILHDFGDGLIMRRATAADTDALVKMQEQAFANPDTGAPDVYLGGWTRDLMGGKHPTFGPQDFLIVQDTRTNVPVSCMCLISQTWTLEGIPFKVGRVEIVGTAAEYRRRGLVREQFRVLHEISARRGEVMQAITGIPYYYRQFGYEYAIELAAPQVIFVPQQVPVLEQGQEEAFRLRHAADEDMDFIAGLYKASAMRTLIHCERDTSMFEYENTLENDPMNGHASWWDVIETRDGERAGIVMRRRYVLEGRHNIHCVEILPQFTWDAVTPFLLRELTRQAQEIENVGSQVLSKLAWFLAPNHPLYTLLGDSRVPLFGAYAWYVRVSDLSAFLRLITPVLEKRLAMSGMIGFSGSLRLNFFRDGLELCFEGGKLTLAQPWRATAGDYGQTGFGNATFPNLTFLKLLLGYRSRAELQEMYPDVVTDSAKTDALLDALFPKRLTHIMPIH